MLWLVHLLLVDVFQLPDASLETLSAVFLHEGIHEGLFVDENSQDVVSEDDRAAGEIAQTKHRLDSSGSAITSAVELDGDWQLIVPLCKLEVQLRDNGIQRCRTGYWP